MTTRRTLLTAALTLGFAWSAGPAFAQETIRAVTDATFPPISTSVARFRPSGSEWRMPYLLSNFDFVTESLTLIAGKSSSPRLCMS